MLCALLAQHHKNLGLGIRSVALFLLEQNEWIALLTYSNTRVIRYL